MTLSLRRLLSLFACFGLLQATPLGAIAQETLEVDHIVAVVGDGVITYRERAMEVLVKKAVAGACEGVVHMK